MFPCQVSVSRLKPQLWQPLKSLELLWGRVLPKIIALTSFKCWIILSLRLVFTFSQSSGHWWHFVEEPADIDWRGTSFQLGFYFPLPVNPLKGRCRKYIWAYYMVGCYMMMMMMMVMVMMMMMMMMMMVSTPATCWGNCLLSEVTSRFPWTRLSGEVIIIIAPRKSERLSENFTPKKIQQPSLPIKSDDESYIPRLFGQKARNMMRDMGGVGFVAIQLSETQTIGGSS